MRPVRRVRTTRATGVALALVAALGLTGCSPELPVPVPAAAPAVPPPVTTIEQTDRILQDVGAVLTAGDAALSAADLPRRLSGPALAVRTAEYAVASATGGARPVTAVPVAAQTLVVPSTTQWPRTQIVVTEQPDDLTSPRLLVLRQDTPRAAYTLWGWARLLPGAQMPPTATPAVGSAPLAADEPGLVATPTDVVAQYADVLSNGDASAFAAGFAAPDPYRQQIEAGRARYQGVVAEGTGTFTETYAPVPDQLFAHATADGGALVVAGMTTSSTLAVTGSSLAVPPELAAVSGGALPAGAVLRNNLAFTYTDVVVFYVPPAGAGTPVRVLGAEHFFTSASGS
ncbi:hypothetical protein [Cellulomonas aerilata]|uniref:DUF8094 domain-containing protein n=1 Tax=Cellulomonas aerilata TaxID=515326 RepID=A0A512DEC0_9CELL|nr:hypothetical protein [Cellulomonas aerilata]GEO34823.1 hypothetical protein CAE01nite_25480 [Cellulomonas aerilata]